MLELKNILEDIVLQTIDQMDEARKGEIHGNQKIELASYVLNRLQPMYATSNKGFTHIVRKYQNDPQFLADLMVKLHEGVKIVQKTKLSGPPANGLKKGQAYYIFPRIYGKAISSKTMGFLESGRVTFYIESRPAKTLYSAWTNPLDIIPEDEGIFSFAPMPIEAPEGNRTRIFSFKIVIEKDGFHYEKYVSYHALSTVYNGSESEIAENALQTEDIYVPF